jgi:four helix bundle protein
LGLGEKPVTAKQFEDLSVWQDARGLVSVVYSVSKQPAFYTDYGLRDQIRRAAVSTLSNIAEGFERGSRKEFIQFLNVAKASNAEVRAQLYVALDQKYVTETEFNSIQESTMILSRKLSSFIRYLERYSSNSRTRKPSPEARPTFNLQPSTFNR